MPSQRPHGFTVVELLVVITVVALLVALLLPALKSAKQSAARVGCQSNLRQHGMALSSYRQEWSRYYPLTYQATDYNGTSYTTAFPYRLRPYLGGKQQSYDTGKKGRHVFYCPAAELYTRDDYQFPLRYDAWLYGPGADYIIATYGMLSGLGLSNATNTYPDPATVGSLRQYHWQRAKRRLTYPAQTMVFADSFSIPRVDHAFQYVQYRHGGQANFLMGDLSMRSMTQAQVTPLWSNPRFHLCDPDLWRYAN